MADDAEVLTIQEEDLPPVHDSEDEGSQNGDLYDTGERQTYALTTSLAFR